MAILLVGACSLMTGETMAQYGPNDPAIASNNTGTGANAWSNPANIFTSNDAYATVATKGYSNYLVATDFGFDIPGPVSIMGIRLDVERATKNPLDVALLDGWTGGLIKTVSAGADRCLIVVFAEENGTTSRDITAMTYGGQAMTPVTEVVYGGGASFSARIEVWLLLEAQIALASSTTIVPTYGAATLVEYCETFSAAVFRNVDQLMPVSSTQISGEVGSTNPHQLGAAIATLDGSMAVNAVISGNNTSPPIANGGTDTYTINSGYTEGTDIYFANDTAAPTSGACLQTAYKLINTAGTERPTCTFAGPVNRHAMVGFTLQRPREMDAEVRLLKGGVIGGTNKAVATPWRTTDAYATYGGVIDLWGRTWTLADINATDFGAAFSAQVQNGTASVDHMRITVYAMSSLPVELLDFRAEQDGEVVRLDWVTATEQDNDHFIVQRSRDGITFQEVTKVEGAGSSTSAHYYSAIDAQPWSGTNYYRLEQVDTDGSTEYSPVVVVQVTHGGLVVFPNPSASGAFTVFDVTLDQEKVAVYTNEMRLVRTHVGTGSDPVIHLEDLPDGTYVLMVRSGADIRTARVVKASSWR